MDAGRRVWALGLVALMVGGPAFGQDASPPVPGGLVQLVPMPPLVGGGPSVDLYLIALNADGTPANGLVLKATKTAGMQSRWIEVGNGVYRLPYAPPVVAAVSQVTATAKGKFPATGDKISLQATIQVGPAPAALGMTASPAALTLGRDAQASLQFTGAPHGVRVLANVGTVEDVTPTTDGAATARYVPPKLNYPHQAILTWADSTNPLGRHGFTVLPLSGAVEYPVKAAPNTSVLLEVQGKKYGPVTAGADGKAKIPIEVPPGAQVATQVTVENGQEKREDLDLKIPETRRIQMMPLPSSLPADPSASVPLRVVVELAAGGGDLAAKPVFSVSGGSVSAPSGLGDGLYEAMWHPPANPGPTEVSVSLGSDVQQDKVSVNLVAPRVGGITLSSSVASLAPDAKAVDVTAKVTDGAGAPMTHAILQFDLTGAEQVGQVVEVGDGAYKVTLAPAPSGPIDVRAHLAPMPSTEPVHDSVLAPSRATVHDDGSDAVDLLVGAVDAEGIPVADVTVTLDLVQGDGTIESKTVVTGHDGAGHTRYVAGSKAAVVGIRAAAGDVTAVATLLQLPANVPNFALPTGTAVDATRFTAPVPSLTIPRAGSPVAAGSTAAVSTLRLASDASTAKAGDTFSVTVSPLDAGGALTTAEPPDVVVTGGSMGARTVNPDGSVVVSVTVPDPVTLPVTVTAKSGAITQSMTVPADAGPWSGEGVAVAPASGAVPDPVPVVPTPKPSRPNADVAWLWIRVAGLGSSYKYEQAPSTDPGPLLPSRLVVGGPDGGSAALPVGGEVDLRGWADQADLPYVGAHAEFRLGSYGITASSFSRVARDVLVNGELDLLGRYPVDVNGERYWIGAKVGVHDNDFMVFEGCLDAHCQIDTSPINVLGLALGAEVGADVGPLDFVGGYTLGLAQFSQPYSNALDLDVAYTVARPLFVNAGFSMVSRSIVLKGADSGLDRGSLNDSQVMFKLGAGVAF